MAVGEEEGEQESPEGAGDADEGSEDSILPDLMKPGTLAFSLHRWERGLMLLLIGAPIALALTYVNGSPTLIFSMAAIAIVPLAALMGRATEELAVRSGPGVSGLLNATFGNAVELIIAGVAIKEGLFAVAKASLAGSIIVNILLVLGLSFVVGGVKHKFQTFQTSIASATLSMLTVSIVGMMMPSMYHYVQSGFTNMDESSGDITRLSLVISILLMSVYFLYLLFSLSTHKKIFDGKHEDETKRVRKPETHMATWPVRSSILVLGITTVTVAAISELMVGQVEAMTVDLGISEIFIGVVIIAIVGNAAEHSSAILMAWRNRTELSFHIAMGSSAQIALFGAPLMVFLSFAIGNPMSLVFEPFELVSMILTLGIATVITLDGEATWFEGAMLVVIFLLVAAVFYVHP
jgi:Ca2+:H+ antiporter